MDHHGSARQRLLVAGESSERRAGDHSTAPTRATGEVSHHRSSESERARACEAHSRLLASHSRAALRRRRLIKRGRTRTAPGPTLKPQLRPRPQTPPPGPGLTKMNLPKRLFRGDADLDAASVALCLCGYFEIP